MQMFKKVNCTHCETSYDETFDECPKCHERNGLQDPSFKNVTMLKFWKQILLFLGGWLGLKIIALAVQLYLYNKMAPLFETEEMFNQYLRSAMFSIDVNAGTYLIALAGLLFVVFEELPKLIKSFKGWKPYVAGLLCFLAILAFDYLYGYIIYISGIKIGSNTNQTGLNSIVLNYPVISLIVLGFVGPICEELTYRVGLFSFLKRINKWLPYLVTIIFFALIHFEFSSLFNGNTDLLINELLNIPYYAFAAFAFTFVYDKFGFAGSLTAHIINNVFSVVSTVFIGLTLFAL